MRHIKIQPEMKVKIKEDESTFPYSGLTIVIEKELPKFKRQRAFKAYDMGAIWLIEDFDYVIGYENFKME